MKLFIISVTIFILVAIGCLVAVVRQFHTDTQYMQSRIQHIETQLNTVGVAQRTEVQGYTGICDLVVVECANEKYTLKLQ